MARTLRLLILACIYFGVPAAQPQELDPVRRLRDEVTAQERQIQEQQKEIEALRAALDEQKQVLQRAMGASPRRQAAQAPPQTAAPAPAPSRTVSPPAHQADTLLPLNASQEVRFSRTSPTLKLGPADIRLQGYVALSALYDTANVGGSIGTNFAGIPFSNTPEGNASEFRLSSQRTRVAVRVDTKLKGADLASYLEADFRGTTSGTVAVTSSSFGFRVRQAWIDYNSGKLQMSGGQMFSLITPVRSEVTPNPAEAMMTYAVDAQYLAGLIWDRSPSIRFAYRPKPSTTFAVALENPEQQVGTAVKFPAALSSVLSTQYNTGTAELRTPNLAPDTIFKASFNFGPPGHRLHIDSGALLRFFRSYDPANISQHKDALGFGGNLNLGWDLTPKLHFVLNGFLSSGGGRYTGGLVPDVVVRANGEISPIKAHSWIGGLEWAATRRSTFFGYYSGVYASRNTAVDANATLVGFGYPGSNAARRMIQESTVGWGQLFWNSESAGSIQLNTQYSYIRNFPWSSGTGPRSANANLVFGQIRYNLP
jgi:hypothetical protein